MPLSTPILQLAALDAALDVWNGVDMADVRARSGDDRRLSVEV